MTYQYALVPVATMHSACMVPTFPDAYISQASDTGVVQELHLKGYRWVRSEGDQAILELAVAEPTFTKAAGVAAARERLANPTSP